MQHIKGISTHTHLQ